LKERSALEVLSSQHFAFDLIGIFIFLLGVFLFKGIFSRLYKQVVFRGNDISFTNTFSPVFVGQFYLLTFLHCQIAFGEHITLLMRVLNVV